jgi:DNA invertase Pin-like site-specific DNA recombinase
MAKIRTPAVVYLRTSSAANVGVDGDTERQQRSTIQAFAKRAGFKIAGDGWYYDAAVSGADPIEGRDGFARLLDRIEGNGVTTVIVEDASRFARDLLVQELAIALLAIRGVRLLTASGDDLTDSDDLGRKMMWQVAGAFMEYEKGRLVAKLRSARERKRKVTGKKVGGRKSHVELWPEVVAKARRLRRAKGKAGRLSYREISARLKDAGYLNERGEPFNPQSVRAMIEGPQRRNPG